MRLAQIMSRELPDLDIQPEDFFEAKGWYRLDYRADCYRWECFTRLKTMPNVSVVFGSYSTMTDCVRYGVSVSDEHRPGRLREIHVESKEPCRKAEGGDGR